MLFNLHIIRLYVDNSLPGLCFLPSSCPATRGRGTTLRKQGGGRGAGHEANLRAARPLHRASAIADALRRRSLFEARRPKAAYAPPPPLALRGGGQTTAFPRRAPRPGLANHHARKKIRRVAKKKRKAERRKAHPTMPRAARLGSALPRPRRRAGARHRTSLRRKERKPSASGALAFRRSRKRRLPERANVPAQPRPCFTRSTSNASVTRAVDRA